MTAADEIKQAIDEGRINPEVGAGLQKFYQNYARSVLSVYGSEYTGHDDKFREYLQYAIAQANDPFEFGHYHPMAREPVDYYTFGNDFFGALVDEERSQLRGVENFEKVEQQLKNGENVFFLANHQTECDPQLMVILLRDRFPELTKKLTFVAGHRVTHDPMAVPFSLGVNLLCIFSKKHILHPPEQRAEKLQHNQRTMKTMREMLTTGGTCIYIAPSGGRDRPNSDGKFYPAPFDAPSLEMTLLQGKQVATPTHYYPLSLWTYPILPPPDVVHRELGEKRVTGYSPIYITLGDEINVDQYPGSDTADKRARRQARADHIHSLVCADYDAMEAIASEARGG